MRVELEIAGEARTTEFHAADNQLTDKIIGAAIEVHRALGPGLLESAYEECLCYELSQLGLDFQRQVELPVRYKCVTLDCGYRIDLIVEATVVVELKTVSELLPVHSAQLLTYLKLSDKPIGLLINFNVTVLKKGLKRVVNHYVGPMPDATPQSLSSSPLLRASALKKQP
ncbi:MAG: GxxExxY protein [Bryobacteraceae bacterium]|jgi:GxxExxY protein